MVVGCDLTEGNEPIPDIAIVNNLDDAVLVRGDLQPSDYSGAGFDSSTSVESPVWKHTVEARSSKDLTLFPKSSAHPKTTNGIFRVMVITPSGETVLNRTFTSKEFDEMDWTLQFD